MLPTTHMVYNVFEQNMLKGLTWLITVNHNNLTAPNNRQESVINNIDASGINVWSDVNNYIDTCFDYQIIT